MASDLLIDGEARSLSITLLCGVQKVAVSAWQALPTLNATFLPAPHYASNVARHI